MRIAKIDPVKGYGRMASGKRINRAADDAAGMAIANKLKANANGNLVGSRNTREGVNVAKIADGAYDSIMERLQRMRELAVQAMNGTNSKDDRRDIQDEIDQHMAGIDESAKNTKYNELKLMDGSYATIEIASNPTGKGSKIMLDSARLDSIGIAGFSVTGDNIDLDTIDRAIEKVSADRSRLGAAQNGLEARDRVNQIAYENMTAARSRIEDLNYAKASSELKSEETLQSVKVSMFRKQKEQDASILKLF